MLRAGHIHFGTIFSELLADNQIYILPSSQLGALIIFSASLCLEISQIYSLATFSVVWPSCSHPRS